MKLLLLFFCLLIAVGARAANPAFSDFNLTQFGTNGGVVSVSALSATLLTSGTVPTARMSALGAQYPAALTNGETRNFTVAGTPTFQNGFSSTGGSNTVGATIFTNALMKSTNLGTSAISYNLPLQNMIIAADTTFTIGAVDASRTLYAETVAIVSNSAAASKTLTPPVNYVLSGTNGVNPGGLNKVILWQDPGWISNMVSIQIR